VIGGFGEQRQIDDRLVVEADVRSGNRDQTGARVGGEFGRRMRLLASSQVGERRRDAGDDDEIAE
jgi:hypothetical protein